MSFGAIPVERGCGSRVENGIYWEMGTGIGGRPIEDFLLDPPVRPLFEIPITPRGVQLIEQKREDGTSVFHVVDWVGAEHYPNVTDFVEEARRFGLSRRLPRNLDFSRITSESRILLVHARAWVDNCAEYSQWRCPKFRESHNPENLPENDCCAGVWWRDVTGGEAFDAKRGDLPLLMDQTEASKQNGYEPIEVSLDGKFHPLLVRRDMPSFSYFAHRAPDGLQPQYSPAFFMSTPCTRLVVVEGGDCQQAHELASEAMVIVEIVER